MPLTAIAAGLVMFVAALSAMPPAPASPEAVQASQAVSAFFFGGAYLICGIFARFHPLHGKSGIFVIATLGVFTALAGLFPEAMNGGKILVPAVLLLLSLPIAISSFRRWQKSRRFQPEEED